MLKVTFVNRPDMRRYAEYMLSVMAAKEGLEFVPGSVTSERRQHDGGVHPGVLPKATGEDLRGRP